LSTDFSKAYELLGVKPGVSGKELKAAHRDLAKVWHPDRFVHDPRLQEKAQEKLKEINSAYELLSSGKPPRAASPPPPPPRTYTDVKATTPRQRSNWQWAAVPLLVFIAGFTLTTRTVLQRHNEPVSNRQVKEATNDPFSRPDANTRAEVSNVQRKAEPESITESTLPVSAPTEPTAVLATVTVTIDPESGLLAKPDCPLRSRMSYPSGSQPTANCNLNHAPPAKESRIKALASKILPQRRKDAKGIQEVQ
jgi:DnaJ domain